MSIFLLSAAIFSLQVLLSPVVATALTGQGVQLVLAAPIIAFALATSALALTRLATKPWTIRAAKAGVLISVPVTFLLLAWIQNLMDGRVFLAAAGTAGKYLSQIQVPIAVGFYLPIMAAIALPYFFYGIFLAATLASSKSVSKTIALEFTGAAAGWFAGVIFLEHWGFAVTLGMVQLLTAGALFAEFPWRSRVSKVGVLAFALLAVLSSAKLEPRRNLNLVAGDLKATKTVTETERSWTTYAKVQTLNVHGAGSDFKIIAMGGGGGMAGIYPFVSGGAPPVIATTEIAKAFHPRKALVVFAGAGRELIALHAAGVSDLVGIEMNPGVILHGIHEPTAHLEEFLHASGARLLQGDARVFLETTPEKFDLILYSWSGATVGHYSGAVMRTTQYEFTEEALAAAWSRLNPNGILLFTGGANKINLLASLRRVAGPMNWRKSIAVLSPIFQNGLTRGWDEFVVIVKKGELSVVEVNALADLNKTVETRGAAPGLPVSQYSLVLTPTASDKSAAVEVLRDYLDQPDPLRALNTAINKIGAAFSSHDDNRPFVYNISPAQLLSWEPTHLAALIFTLLLIAALFSRGFSGGLRPALFFSAIGFFPIGLQVLAVYKFLLYFSNPTMAVLLAVSGLMSASALAAWLSPKLPERMLSLALPALGLVTAALWCGGWWSGPLTHAYFTMPSFLRAAGLLFPILISAAVATIIFTRKLAASREKLWALLLDSLGAVLAVLWIPLFVEAYGFKFSAVLLMAVFILAIVTAGNFKTANR